MTQLLIMDPAGDVRDGWHEMYGDAPDALNGNISRIFLTGVPMSVPTTDCNQPDGWSCGPYALAECLGHGNGEDARAWLQARGWIDSEYGTWYEGIVGYLNSCGYTCEYNGVNYDGVMESPAFAQLIQHINAGFKAILCMHHKRTTFWTEGGHYICVYGVKCDGLVEDGLWGCATTKRAQEVFGTTPDGIISGQNRANKPFLPNCQPASWKFVKEKNLTTGSELIRAIQRHLGLLDDGFFGNETRCAFQRWLGVDVDSYIGGATVSAFQRWLNRQ